MRCAVVVMARDVYGITGWQLQLLHDRMSYFLEKFLGTASVSFSPMSLAWIR